MLVQRSSCARLLLVLALLSAPFDVATARADEFWVAPTSQQDLGGLQVASNGFWPVTPVGAVRFAFAIPNDLQAFQAAKVVLIPHAPGGAANLNVFVCPAQNGGAVVGACAGPFAHGFAGAADQLVEVDISGSVAPRIGTPGATYLAVLAYTAPTTLTDHIVGLRFAYAPTMPDEVATLGANTYSGVQTAPAFIGDGSGLTNLPTPPGVATLGANTFGGTQTAPAFVGNGSGLTNLPFPSGAATLGANIFTGTQTINTGNIDLDASTAASGNLTKDGVRFLHNFGGINGTFLGMNAGNFTTTTFGDNTGIGTNALTSLTTGSSNTAVGARAMLANTSGFQNTAVGRFALAANTTGGDNTTVGDGALDSNTNGSGNTGFGAHVLGANTTGFNNTAIGDGALGASVSGANNTAVGHIAGLNVTTGSNNVYLGSASLGAGDESDTMRLGAVGFQTRTFISGVRDVAVTGGEMVLIDLVGQLGSGPVLPAANSVGSGEVVDNSLTANDLASDAVGSSELAANSVIASKVAFNYAGSASEGGAAGDLSCVACVAAGEVGFAFATPSANTFTGTQTINNGNLDLDTSGAATGNITKNGSRFVHNFSLGTFLGTAAGNFTMTGEANTGIGSDALHDNTTGAGNIAIGHTALKSNTSGGGNTAVGTHALVNNEAGNGNVALGWGTLLQNTVGTNNVAVGYAAGLDLSIGSNNIYLGANVEGVSGEINTMYLGKVGTQTKTYIAGVRGIPTGFPNAVPVVIDSLGQLGTVNSSRRFKEDVRDMADASQRLLQLRPVTFRYTQAYKDGSKPIQYGLVAEEVADVFPELAVRNADGDFETVHYETLNVLLLNEVQKQEALNRRQQERIEDLERLLNDVLARLIRVTP